MKNLLAFLKFYWKTLWLGIIVVGFIIYGILHNWDELVMYNSPLVAWIILLSVIGLLPLYGVLIYYFQYKPNKEGK